MGALSRLNIRIETLINFKGAHTVDRNARLPLPVEFIAKVRERLSRAKRPELLLIWRILEGTGYRPSEISGLRLQDV